MVYVKESKRFKMLESNVSPGLMIYDKLADKVVVDICTNNRQIDEIIAKCSFEIIHNKDFLNYIMELI